MTKRIWIKLYIEILDDDKFGTLPEFMKWRAIELFLVAGENGNDGLLPPVERLAWRLRLPQEKLKETLSVLSQAGVVHETPQGWLVTNFKKRQYSESMERTRRYRTRNGDRHSDGTGDGISDGAVTDDDSISYSVSDSSLEERGVGGETKPPPSEAEAEFVAHFRAFNGKREAQRWETLVEAIGMARAQEIAAWAERKEIHMVNRGGLLDSLETAARKWIDAPSGKTSFLEQLKVA